MTGQLNLDVEFDSFGQKRMIDFIVQEEKPNVYYKMRVKKKYECAFYNTTTLKWDKGSDSGQMKYLSANKHGRDFDFKPRVE